MKCAALALMAWVFRVRLEVKIDKHDATFLRRFNRITPKSSTYQSGMVFKLMVGIQQPFEIGRCHSSFPASAK